MGASFSIPTLKVQLKSAIERMKMQIGKHTNLIKVQRKELADLLEKKKDETARIKVESMLALKNMIICLETLQLMCELLVTRIMLIGAEKQCPSDLVEAVASIVYCARRTEVPELGKIAEQFASKYTVEWVKPHTSNASGKVSPRIVQCLAIHPPDIALVLSELKDIAEQYQVDWEPDLSAQGTPAGDGSGNDGNSVNKIGAIAPVHAPATPPAASAAPAAAAAAGAGAGAVKPTEQQKQPEPMRPQPPADAMPAMVMQPAAPMQPYVVVGDPNGGVMPMQQVMVMGGSPPPSIHTLPLQMQPTPNPQPGAPFSSVPLVSPAGPMVLDPAVLVAASPASSFSDGSAVRLRYAEHEIISFPGTLNVLIHEGKQLWGNPKDPYVKMGVHGEPNSLKTSVNHGGGHSPSWQMEHLPFAVKGGGSKLVVEAYSSKALLSDGLIGRCFIDVEYLVRHPDPHWYPLGRDAGGKTPAGHVLLSSQYLPLNVAAAAAGSPVQGGGGVAMPMGGPMPGGSAAQPIVVMEHGNMQVFTPVVVSPVGGQSAAPVSAPEPKGAAAGKGAGAGRVGGADGSLELNTLKPSAAAVVAPVHGDEKAALLSRGGKPDASGGPGTTGSDAGQPGGSTLGDVEHNPFAALSGGGAPAGAGAAGRSGRASPSQKEGDGGRASANNTISATGGVVPKLAPPPFDDAAAGAAGAAGADGAAEVTGVGAAGAPGGSAADDDLEARLAELNK